MKKRSLATLTGYRARAVSPTGHHCPKAGWWLADEDIRGPRFIAQGEVMPAVNGRPTRWTLCDEANNCT